MESHGTKCNEREQALSRRRAIDSPEGPLMVSFLHHGPAHDIRPSHAPLVEAQ
jgi:hypothetical protein